jgi:hypothetical protein
MKRISMTNVAYLGLLLAFVALGASVYALAVGSGLAAILGAGTVVLLSAAVVGFRVGARRIAESDESGNPVDGANLWAQPVRQAQIDRYLSMYRGIEPAPTAAQHAEFTPPAQPERTLQAA